MRPSGSKASPPTDPAPSPEQRRSACQPIVLQLLLRRDRGEVTEDDNEIIATHAHLLPELAEELEGARLCRRAVSMGLKAQGALATRLGSDASEGSISARHGLHRGDEDQAGDGSRVKPLPRIPGCVRLGRLSSGGQATVYRGVQESTGRTVAIKVMSGPAARDATHRTRFEREARILALLRHPHIVDIVDCGRTFEGDFYIVMDYVDGCDLDAWCDHELTDNAAGSRQLLELFKKICGAVEAAHTAGIIHRDLKPSNIRVDSDGQPRLLDFGLARTDSGAAERTVTVSGQLVGSLPWASPEQAAGGSCEVDARSDVYALGVILYEAISGVFPYPIDGPLYELLHNIANGEVRPPSTRSRRGRRGVSPVALDAVILKALAKKPQERYESAGLLGSELERLLEGKRPIAYVAPRAQSGRRLLAAAIGVVIAASVMFIVMRPPAPPQVFALPSINNAAGMHMVRIPAGQFHMGSMLDEPGRDRAEVQRLVTVAPFLISITEVTQAEFERVTGRAPPDQRWLGADLPVHNVTLEDAITFCRQLSEREGRRYRLPNEEEWEYACRAGSMTSFFGQGGGDAVAWYAENSGGRVHSVAGKWPNSWGLYDTHGNVREWCDSPFTPISNMSVLRGGSVRTPEAACRAAAREGLAPRGRADDIGFRVALDAVDDRPLSRK